MEAEDLANKFGAVEYVVFSLVLVLSAGIGIFYGCFGSKQKSTEEFLMANRQMGAFPVALSLVCSFISAVTLLGNPTEVYFYGTQYFMIILSFIPMTLCVAYLYVPVFFHLQVSSAFEYLELRFSRRARVLVSFLSVFHLTVYMAVVVYGPSLALEQVTGINTRLSTGAIFVVCIFYSSIGGLKAVLWTDALQAFIMLASLIVVVTKGMIDVGGMNTVWERADNTSRIEFFNFDPDPRTRHTFWTATVGGFFMWLPMYVATQAQVQRYLALPSMPKVRQALLINMIGLFTVTVLWFLSGLVIYAKYYECDPVKSKIVNSADQLLPQLVMETSADIKGLPGLFVAGITCASLSTVSSGLNAIACVITFDYLKNAYPHFSDSRLSNISKIISVVFGALSFAFVFIAENMEGLTTAAAALHALIVGPTLGLFTLGMFFPFANTKGSVIGVILTFIILALQVIGNNIAQSQKKLPDQTLLLTTMGCSANVTDTPQIYPALDWKNQGDSVLIQILSMSYMWQLVLTSVFSLFFGLIFSAIFNMYDEKQKVEKKLLSLPIYRMWKKIWPRMLDEWVCETKDEEEKEPQQVEMENGKEK